MDHFGSILGIRGSPELMLLSPSFTIYNKTDTISSVDKILIAQWRIQYDYFCCNTLLFFKCVLVIKDKTKTKQQQAKNIKFKILEKQFTSYHIPLTTYRLPLTFNYLTLITYHLQARARDKSGKIRHSWLFSWLVSYDCLPICQTSIWLSSRNCKLLYLSHHLWSELTRSRWIMYCTCSAGRPDWNDVGKSPIRETLKFSTCLDSCTNTKKKKYVSCVGCHQSHVTNADSPSSCC